MLSLFGRRRPALFLTGALGTVSAAACSPQSERPRVAVIASSADTVAPDTMATADTTPPTRPAAGTTETPPQKPAAQPPAKPPKPSIDPAPKNPRPMVVPKPTGTPSPEAGAAAPAATGRDQPVKYDAASNTVTFELSAGPFNFNGYTSGGATLTVPSKANVVINFVNKDGTPHSAEVISGEGPIPNAAVDPAIPRAYTNKVLEGLPQEATDILRFTVPASGKYRIFCGVPGHGLSGMWIWMTIDPAAKAPSFGPTKG